MGNCLHLRAKSYNKIESMSIAEITQPPKSKSFDDEIYLLTNSHSNSHSRSFEKISEIYTIGYDSD